MENLLFTWFFWEKAQWMSAVYINCGLAVNHDGIEAQREGSVVFALSAELDGKITLNNGALDQSNFQDYPLLRCNEAPKVTTIILNE